MAVSQLVSQCPSSDQVALSPNEVGTHFSEIVLK